MAHGQRLFRPKKSKFTRPAGSTHFMLNGGRTGIIGSADAVRAVAPVVRTRPVPHHYAGRRRVGGVAVKSPSSWESDQ